jgi:hypothetical protein
VAWWSPSAATWLRCPAMVEREAGRERREREGRERKEREADLNSIFLQNLHGNSKCFEYESCVTFQNIQIFSGKSLFEQCFKSYFKFTTTRI